MWTNDLRKEINFVDAKDGSFWIDSKDFVNEFSEIGVCKVHEDYIYNSIEFNDTS